MPDKCFDLAIVDPPYGINIGGESGGKIGGDKPFGKRGFEKAGRNKCVDAKVYHVFKDTHPPEKEYFDELRRVSKNQIIFGANHFISKIPMDSSCWIVWDKDNSGNFADCELAWTSFDTAVRKYKYRWNGMLQEHMGKDKEARIHPTQKPEDLYRWILKTYAKPGDKILDTHLGSGSIAIACWDMGYDLTGYEIDKDYFDAASKRLENHKKQLVMF
jgi:site-specific DNA-methyltransferase (adenine-specific)